MDTFRFKCISVWESESETETETETRMDGDRNRNRNRDRETETEAETEAETEGGGLLAPVLLSSVSPAESWRRRVGNGVDSTI